MAFCLGGESALLSSFSKDEKSRFESAFSKVESAAILIEVAYGWSDFGSFLQKTRNVAVPLTAGSAFHPAINQPPRTTGEGRSRPSKFQ